MKTNANTYQRRSANQNSLTKPQLEFLNSHACRKVSPYSRNFWQEMANSLAAQSRQVEALPYALNYRRSLEPYLFRQVHMVADHWSIVERGDDYIHLLLQSVHLKNVHGSAIGATPNVTVDHLNIWVSPAWYNRVIFAYNERLALDGVLYQYANANWTRNIGLMPVLVMPESRKVSRWTANRKNCARCPYVRLNKAS